jgi:hypothetical protein
MQVPKSPDQPSAGPTGAGGAPAAAALRASTRARRPATVTILAVLQLLTAAAYGAIVAALVMTGPDALTRLLGDMALARALLGKAEMATVVVIVAGYAVATLAAGILLLRMRQLGWTSTMLLTGLGLVSAILTWWGQGTTIPIWLFVQVVTVFYLNQRQVREAFGISRREAGDALSDDGATYDRVGATPSEAGE